MTYLPLLAVLLVLVIGAATTLTVLFYAGSHGYFRNLKSGAYVIFDEDEPVGEPQDQFFREAESDEDSSAPAA